jgi:hypothetical protein
MNSLRQLAILIQIELPPQKGLIGLTTRSACALLNSFNSVHFKQNLVISANLCESRHRTLALVQPFPKVGSFCGILKFHIVEEFAVSLLCVEA